jgi:hypothetical protein
VFQDKSIEFVVFELLNHVSNHQFQTCSALVLSLGVLEQGCNVNALSHLEQLAHKAAEESF